MMRRQRKALPLIALLGFEVSAIVVLHAMGSVQSMQIPWDDMSTWLETGTVDQLAAPMVRTFALALAYWMFVSTALTVLAQLSRIPGAVQAVSFFTLPSVRRVVDGAMVVSIATSSFVGVAGSPAMAASSAADITTSISASEGGFSVPTPRPAGPAELSDFESAGNVSVGVTIESPSSSKLAIAEGTTADTGDDGSASVPTPRVGVVGDAVIEDATTSTSTTTTSTTTTLIPRSPAPTQTSTPDPAPAPAQTEVLGVQQYQVKAGDNLWTIARDTVAAASNRSASDITNQEIWEYWEELKGANEGKLRSGDPHWIFPDEVIDLPVYNAQK